MQNDNMILLGTGIMTVNLLLWITLYGESVFRALLFKCDLNVFESLFLFIVMWVYVMGSVLFVYQLIVFDFFKLNYIIYYGI